MLGIVIIVLGKKLMLSIWTLRGMLESSAEVACHSPFPSSAFRKRERGGGEQYQTPTAQLRWELQESVILALGKVPNTEAGLAERSCRSLSLRHTFNYQNHFSCGLPMYSITDLAIRTY